MEYTVLESERMRDLIASVNYWMQFGWEPQGGVSHTSEKYIQAMIKRS